MISLYFLWAELLWADKEHLELLHAVFVNLEKHNLKLKPSKCEFILDKLVYLGHVVSSRGTHVDITKTDKELTE